MRRNALNSEIRRLRECCAVDMTVSETARALGRSTSFVKQWARTLGLTFRPLTRLERSENAKRARATALDRRHDSTPRQRVDAP